jgi:hypothetical protein
LEEKASSVEQDGKGGGGDVGEMGADRCDWPNEVAKVWVPIARLISSKWEIDSS